MKKRMVEQHTDERYVFILVPTDQLDLDLSSGFYPTNKEGMLRAPFRDMPGSLPVAYACWFDSNAFSLERARKMAQESAKTYGPQYLAKMRQRAQEQLAHAG